MLLIIGIALILYGYVTFKYSYKRRNKKGNQSVQLPEWFPLMHKLGGLLLIIIGLLLSLTYFIL